ncbi:hypothetical protein wVul_0311 [Wolbachia endosymbiont of Armadillidium vulgare str. wVulC]|nr:hypothetical protein wVul_0311 [Wolbachia endosymbiont of Armadillidium vulgare str. wVulC]
MVIEGGRSNVRKKLQLPCLLQGPNLYLVPFIPSLLKVVRRKW